MAKKEPCPKYGTPIALGGLVYVPPLLEEEPNKEKEGIKKKEEK